MVGELATKDMVVVLNKVDQLPEEGRSKVINKAKKRLRQTLSSTKFAGCAMVSTAVKPGELHALVNNHVWVGNRLTSRTDSMTAGLHLSSCKP